MARYNEIVRDLGRGRPQPIFDVDERNGDVLWELWVDGLAQAIALRPDDWAADLADEPEPSPLPSLATLIAVARNQSDLDSVQINALQDDARAAIVAHVTRLYASRLAAGVAASATSAKAAKVGRNDACPCGSGRKHKRCCGAAP